MRHLGSILLSVILAPAIYLLTGIGMVRMTIRPDHLTLDALVGFAALLGAGALYAVLILARLSPVGTLLAGLAYLVINVWYLVSPELVTHLPKSIIGVQGAATVPLSGIAAVLAVPLLATLVSPRRWRATATPGAAPSFGGGYPPPASYMPGAEPPMSRYPAYQPVPAPGVAAPLPNRPVPAQPAHAQPSSPQLPEPVGPYQPQLGSYAPPNPGAPPPAPLWPGSPGSHSGEADDPDGTRRL